MISPSVNPIHHVEYLNALLASLDESVVATDENLCVQYMNKKAEQLFGVTAEEAAGRPTGDIMNFIYPGNTRDEAYRSLMTTGAWKGQLQCNCKTGKLLSLDVSVTAVKNGHQNTVGYVGVHRDVTDQNRAQTSLQTFLSFISATEDYVFVVDKELKIAFIDEYTNRRLADIYGNVYAAGDDVLEKMPINRRQQIRDCFEAALLGRKSNYDINITTVHGGKMWLQVNYFPVLDTHGFITHACCLAKDITAQKQVADINEKLYRSRKLFETFMENSPILSWITDREGNIRYLNPAYLASFNLQKDIIGQPVSVLFPEDYVTTLRQNDLLVLESREPLQIIEAAADSNGVERTYQVIKFPVDADDAAYIGGWAIDITKEITVHRNLSDSVEKLKLSEETLKNALQQEQQLNDLKSRFVSMASHEFKTPLSTMLSSAYLLEKYNTTEQQPQREKHARKITEAIHHLNALLDDFLNLGRLEEGKLKVEWTTVDVVELVNEVMEELEPIKKTGQVVYFETDDGTAALSDKKLLKNILVNLLSNAFKFSNVNGRIWVALHTTGSHWQLVVRDEGIGISRADQAHLFETFFRGENAKNIQGTGLGLHIVKRYAELIHARLEIESDLGVGTKVMLVLPKGK